MVALNGCIQRKARSSSSALISCIPILRDNGPYNPIVSFDFFICLDLGRCSIVLMLWRRSHIFTNTTRTSFDIASIIFCKLLASRSIPGVISSFPNLLTPSTISATSFPNNLARFLLLTSQSSSTSCNRAEQIVSGSIRRSSNIWATSIGCDIYLEPSCLDWPS